MDTTAQLISVFVLFYMDEKICLHPKTEILDFYTLSVAIQPVLSPLKSLEPHMLFYLDAVQIKLALS